MIKLTTIKSNPNNPRVIRDEKFKKLVKSIEEFPKMMALRPMVVNEDMVAARKIAEKVKNTIRVISEK